MTFAAFVVGKTTAKTTRGQTKLGVDPNGSYSLAEARRNFASHLIMYDPARPNTRIGGSDSPVELEAKRAMIAAFNAMPSAPDDTTLAALWQKVVDAEAILTSETNRKVKEYETSHEG
jgi:hypothetical protein